MIGLETSVTRLLGISIPLFCSVATVFEAVAVAEAGALPLLSALGDIRAVRAATDRPFGLVLGGVMPPACVPVLLTPGPLARRPGAGHWFHDVATRAEAEAAAGAGVDGLIVHGGSPVLQAVALAVPYLPLVAGCPIEDGAQLAAALAAGAGAGMSAKGLDTQSILDRLAHLLAGCAGATAQPLHRISSRSERSAESLRLNLQRRKQQARDRRGKMFT